MSKKQVIIVDIMRDIVAKVATEYKSPVTYLHGSVEEIEATLIEITQAESIPGYTGVKKYPLIALFQDFPENRSEGGYYCETLLPVMLIATLTDPNYRAEQRYAASFKPILYPIYSILLQEIAKNKNIVERISDEIPHRKFDRLYYGKKKLGTGIGDYVDAIELQNIKLTLRQFC
jgi:hypothetical protein